MTDLSGAVWRKATASQNQGACVEVAAVERVVAVRDSKFTDYAPLVVAATDWAALVRDVPSK